MRFNKWNRWIDVIYEDINTLLINRYIFREVRDIIKNNPKIQKPSLFYDLLGIGYAASAAMGIRRQVKIDKDSISFARLLKEIYETPEILSRTRYVALYKGSSFEKAYKQIPNENVEEFASREFDKYVGKPVNDHVDPNMVKSDLETFKKKAQNCEKFADRRIAHFDKRPLTNIPMFVELDECIDFLKELMKKYYPLFRTLPSHLDSIESQIDPDWKEIFREVWLPLDETEDLLELAAKVYQGLSNDQINEIESIALNRRDFFGDRKS